MIWASAVRPSAAVIIGGMYWSRGTTAGAWTGMLTGQEIFLLTMVGAISACILTSLATCRQPFNLDRMLHRGPYARPDDDDGAPTVDSLRSPCGLPLAVFLCYASIPVLLSKKLFSGSNIGASAARSTCGACSSG